MAFFEKTVIKLIQSVLSLWKGWVDFAPKFLLAVLAFALLTVFVQLSQSVSRATNVNGVELSYSSQTNDVGSTARVGVKIKNSSGSGKKIQIKKETYWCNGVGGGDGTAKVKCFDHGNAGWDGEFVLAGGQETSTDLSQQIGNNGNCGSAQVDIYVKVDGTTDGPYGGVAFKEPCPSNEKHFECVNDTCVKKDGPGPQSCDSSCGKVTRYKCDANSTCSPFQCKKGDSNCVTSCNRNDPNACKTATKYNTCENQSCVQKTCPVGQTCQTTCNPNDVNACKNQVTKYKCNANNTCAAFQCFPGDVSCVTSCDVNDVNACKSQVTKYKCSTDNTCAAFQCFPGDANCVTSCDVNDVNACKSQVTKYKCSTDNTCAAFQCFPGDANCVTSCDISDSSACKQTYFACDNFTCKKFVGSGTSTCANDDQCKAKTHFECSDNTCKEVAGGGSSDCSNDDQCKPVVNQNTFCDWLFVDPQTGSTGLTVNAQISGHTQNGGTVVQYRFNFGDGTGDTVQSGDKMPHTYTQNGTFVVNGYVIDNRGVQAGGSGACQKVVQVTAPGITPPPPSGKGGVPATGAETLLLPLFSLLGTFGWAIKRIRGN